MQMRHNIHNLAHILRYLMVRLQPGVLDIETDDVGFAGKLLEEELLGIVTMGGLHSQVVSLALINDTTKLLAVNYLASLLARVQNRQKWR